MPPGKVTAGTLLRRTALSSVEPSSSPAPSSARRTSASTSTIPAAPTTARASPSSSRSIIVSAPDFLPWPAQDERRESPAQPAGGAEHARRGQP